MKEIERRIADVIAITPRPEQPSALVELGEQLLLKDQADLAIKCFDKALQIDQRCVDAWLGRAFVLSAKGQKGQAIGCLDRALDVKPDHEDAKARKAKLLTEMAQTSSRNRRFVEPPPPVAAPRSEPKIEVPRSEPKPEPTSVPDLAAVAPKSEPQPPISEPKIEAAPPPPPSSSASPSTDEVELDGEPRSHEKRGSPEYEDASILFASGRHIESLRKVEPLTRQKDVPVEVWMLRGKICVALGQADAAIESFEKATKAAPTFVPAWIELMKANLEAKRYERALAVAERAAKVAPTDPDVHKLRGQALIMLKRHGEAVAALEISVKHAPDDAEALLELARALGSLSKKDEARDKAKRALALAEAMNPEVVAAVEELLTKLG